MHYLVYAKRPLRNILTGSSLYLPLPFSEASPSVYQPSAKQKKVLAMAFFDNTIEFTGDFVPNFEQG